MEQDYKNSLEHAWKYFELHAQQRISVFNFFLATTGLVAAGVGICFQQGGSFVYISSALSLFLMLVTFLFWKLDQRVSDMIKRAEKAIEVMEIRMTIPEAQLFHTDSQSITSSMSVLSIWSYGRCFRISFITVSLLCAINILAPLFF